MKVSQCLKDLVAKAQCALIPFITAGDPDLETTAEALQILDRHGADLIELGVPYSDPLADGPVIQAAATRALAKGVTLDDVLRVVGQVKPQLRSPIILFTYYNPIFHRGIEAFCQKIAAAGIQGLVVPDLPLEEAESFLAVASQYNIEVTLLVAPTSPLERIKSIAAKSQGFIYLVSVTGVTGMRRQVENRVRDLIASLKSVTDKPIGVGFGISEPQQARQIKEWGADAVIVGSAFVKRLQADNPEPDLNTRREAALQEIAQFCQELKRAIS